MATSIAAAALQVEARRMSRSARNVANVNTDGYEATQAEATAESADKEPEPHNQHLSGAPPLALPPSTTDVAQEQITQMRALSAFKANVKVFQTAQQMDETLLDTKV